MSEAKMDRGCLIAIGLFYSCQSVNKKDMFCLSNLSKYDDVKISPLA